MLHTHIAWHCSMVYIYRLNAKKAFQSWCCCDFSETHSHKLPFALLMVLLLSFCAKMKSRGAWSFSRRANIQHSKLNMLHAACHATPLSSLVCESSNNALTWTTTTMTTLKLCPRSSEKCNIMSKLNSNQLKQQQHAEAQQKYILRSQKSGQRKLAFHDNPKRAYSLPPRQPCHTP